MTEPVLSRALLRRRPYLLRVLRDLIRLSTVNPPGRDYLPCCTYLRERLAELGFSAKVHRVPKTLLRRTWPDLADFPRANVLGSRPHGAPHTLHFNAHFDVVPASAAGWTGSPFQPAVREGWIYGRGAADMKGAVASLLLALHALHDLKARPGVNLEVSFTADEETDSTLGAAWLLEEGLVRADHAIICEGGGNLGIGVGHNGVLWFQLTLEGKAAHASTPKLGINAVSALARLVPRLERYARSLQRIRFRAPDGSLRTATLNIGGVVQTGEDAKINTVPGSVALTLDRRLLPNEDAAAAEADLRQALTAAADLIAPARLRVERLNCQEACFLDPNHPLPAGFAASVKRIHGRSPAFITSFGFNDAHYFSRIGGLPVIGYGPVGENDHGPDERIRIDDLLTTAAVYADFILGGGSFPAAGPARTLSSSMAE
ncbi:MAG: ArgE/DapE family deacylase [Puniceicoccaceae bacterium]|nr:MAG: ArgE/DapE family deacylase [Puniceicoccaceae bacterium]